MTAVRSAALPEVPHIPLALGLQEDSEGKADDTLEWGDEGTSLAGQLNAAHIDASICNHAMLSALYNLCKCTLS